MIFRELKRERGAGRFAEALVGVETGAQIMNPDLSRLPCLARTL